MLDAGRVPERLDSTVGLLDAELERGSAHNGNELRDEVLGTAVSLLVPELDSEAIRHTR